jgi:ribonuclease Y
MNPILIVVAVVLGLAAVALAAILFTSRSKLSEYQNAGKKAAEILAEATTKAERQAKEAAVQARDIVIQAKDKFEKESESTRTELRELERRLSKREDSASEQADLLVRKEKMIEALERRTNEKETQLDAKRKELDKTLADQTEQLKRVSGLSREQAQEMFLTRIRQEMEHEEAEIVKALVDKANEEATDRARNIVVQAIQRMASEFTTQSTVSSIDIPSDEMKGRVIGREGRNIRAFEKATGVDVIVDDTPGVIVVSAHDSVRREIARRAMGKLIIDGRIHPARIEEVVAETQKEIEHQIDEVGRRVVLDMKVRGLNAKLIPLLGRLQFRTSYGQNVLQHSVEVANLSGMIAEQLGLDATLARRCGLLHDIGKAVDHEVEGGHPAIGADLARRYGERPEVIEAVGGHHDVKPASDVYSWIVSAADAVSASRPGARRESIERYVQRLEKLEAIAMKFQPQGVESAFAIQAGREVRVLVNAERADDAMAMKLARDIAKQIETELTFPGEVRITCIREKRAVEYARYAS